jgi:hypothetical protein
VITGQAVLNQCPAPATFRLFAHVLFAVSLPTATILPEPLKPVAHVRIVK